MSFKISWAARKNARLDDLASALKLKRSGARTNVPTAPYCGLELPNGWALVLNNFAAGEDFMLDLATQQRLATPDGLVLYTNDETSMSIIFGYRDGREAWTVLHDPRDGPEHLNVTGEQPTQLEGIIHDYLRAQDQADGEVVGLYGVPTTLGHALIGFRHDEAPSQPFDILRKRRLGLF